MVETVDNKDNWGTSVIEERWGFPLVIGSNQTDENLKYIYLSISYTVKHRTKKVKFWHKHSLYDKLLDSH